MTGSRTRDFDAILFDLDGTLVDTAPDMVAVLLGMQNDRSLTRLPYGLARSHVSNGAIGLVQLAFPDADDAQAEDLRLEYLERYEKAVCVESTLFPGMGALLDELDADGHPWGVVTNKPMRMTDPLLVGLGLGDRAACSISGDTLPQRKPHPAPLLLASQQLGVPAGRTVYVGDAARDVEAGRAAGMFTIAAAYGYITEDDDPAGWNANLVAASTLELAQFLLKGVTLVA
jgi:phosphoglycolate phosphatase